MATIGVGVTDVGLAYVSYGASRRGLAMAADRLGASVVVDPALTDPVTRQLAEYFTERRKSFDLTLDWRLAEGVNRQVLGALRDKITFGRTITYGDLAKESGAFDDTPPGDPFGARAVGTVMSNNPLPIVVPCHRVVASTGIGGYGAGIATKRWLLTMEGSLEPTLFDI
jgi:methylated-DNA-[protein]-cysteine S-methyltransferase